ncbi:MAG: homogentisate 1,2-dioxygenase [candidate division Zixibacteria bacterium]|nr:homogentisate 1,2-dioxygenase [candidate division Zixibacteria bacterium]
MPFYHKLGEIPRVKHTTFYKEDGKSLYREELFSSKGFSGVYSNKYHFNLPTSVKTAREIPMGNNIDWPDAPVLYFHFFTEQKQTPGDFIRARNVFLRNAHCVISTAHVNKETEDFFRNAYGTEYVFVHYGTGEFLSEFGRIPFEPGDQFIIPRAVTYQFKFDDYSANNKLVFVESDTAFEIPKHYHNEYGQLEEHAPYCERDIKVPQYMEPRSDQTDFRVILKAGEKYFEHIVPHHPFGVVGWDGFLYPFALNIKSYHPKVGRIHLPPPAHLCFKTGHFILCNFVPRLFDFYPSAIPAPYFHSNIDSDEVLYYVEGDFMSRKGVKEGSITLHPGGMPHGPQPGKTEESIGARETNEYALMIDTYAPLRPTINVRDTLDRDYAQSWLVKS